MKGFSLLEIILAISILSLLALASFKGYSLWYQQKVLSEAVAELTTALNLAKTLSTISDEKVYLCTSANHQTCDDKGEGDLVIFTTDDPTHIENILQSFMPFPQEITFAVSHSFKDEPLYFMNNGETANNASFSLGDGAHTINFTLSETGIVSPQN